MIDFFSYLSHWLIFIYIAIFIFLAFLFVQVFIESIKNKSLPKEGFKKLIYAFIFSVSFIWVLARGMSYAVESKIKNISKNNDSSIYINGNILPETEKNTFIADIGDAFKGKPSGSYPKEAYEVILLNNESSYEFQFKRDSKKENYYWVYYVGYKNFGKIFYVETDVIPQGK